MNEFEFTTSAAAFLVALITILSAGVGIGVWLGTLTTRVRHLASRL